MVGVAAKAALSPLGTVDGAVVGEDFPTFVTEVGEQGSWAAIGVRTVVRLEGGFFGKDSLKHTCGDAGVDEPMGSGE